MSDVLDLYFMHYPPAALAQEATQLLETVRSKGQGGTAPMPAERLHITLHPLGRYLQHVPERDVRAAMAAGESLEAEPFQVSLDQLGSRNMQEPVSHVELVAHGPGAKPLRRFRRQLVDALRRVGLASEMVRDIFTPHITLDYRHAPVARRRVRPLAWWATDFCLVASHYGEGRHEVLARWQLQRRQTPLFD